MIARLESAALVLYAQVLEGEQVKQRVAASNIPDFGPGSVLEVKLVSCLSTSTCPHATARATLPWHMVTVKKASSGNCNQWRQQWLLQPCTGHPGEQATSGYHQGPVHRPPQPWHTHHLHHTQPRGHGWRHGAYLPAVSVVALQSQILPFLAEPIGRPSWSWCKTAMAMSHQHANLSASCYPVGSHHRFRRSRCWRSGRSAAPSCTTCGTGDGLSGHLHVPVASSVCEAPVGPVALLLLMMICC
jgi:hypothetical protein